MAANYIVKNLTVDLVEDRAHVCISCNAGAQPTTVSVDFPLHVSAANSDQDLRSHARDKARLILGRALQSMEEGD